MELRTVKVSELIPYEHNPRHNEQAVDAVMESIKQCGYVSPIIVDEDMVVLAGHTRLKALERMGIEDVQIGISSGMTEEQKRKFRILDNKTNEFADWDFAALENELYGLDFGDFDFGFDIEDTKYEKIDDEGIGTVKAVDHTFSLDSKKYPITDEEYEELYERFNQHIDEYGVTYGFIRRLLHED